ncbi:MFS transporter [Candidatus Bathyarchaeota archaeon]|nr:MFS transporter [Candidatus Bathyarchaeota archaeon]
MRKTERLILLLFLSGYVLFAMFRTIGGVVLPRISLEFTLSDVEAGSLISSAMLSTAVAMALVGYISNAIGREKSLLLGYLLLTSGIVLAGFTAGFNSCLLAFVIASFGAGILVSTLYAFVGDVLPRSRGFLLGFTNSLFALGGFIGPWLAGTVLEMHNWREVFKILGSVAFPVLVVLLILYAGSQSVSHGIPSVKGTYRKALQNRNVISLCLMMASANLAFITFLSWTPTFLLRTQGLEVSQAGLLIGTVSIFGAIGSVAFGLLSDKIGRGLLNGAIGISAGVVSYVLYSGFYGFDVLMSVAALFGLVCYAYWNLTIGLAQDYASREEIVLVTGLVTYSGTIGAVFGPFIAGLLVDVVGLGGALITCVTVPFLLYGFASLMKTS